MKHLFTLLFLLLVTPVVRAQDTAPDARRQPTDVRSNTPGETAVAIGKQFLGRPYEAHTLDVNPTEQLIVNVRTFDCTTFLETVLALTLTRHDALTGPTPVQENQTFRRYLTRLRYRNGRIDGYASRLHYFSDWLRDNERRGLLTDVTRELPGSILVSKPVSYMTTTTYQYPPLRDPVIFRQVARAEASLNEQSFAFIPKKNIRQTESLIREGDIVMLTAARPGLDMKHVGLAVRQPNGRIHLLHASSERGAVVITPYPLSDYVLAHKRLSGIRVARLRADGEPTAAARGK